MVLVKKLIALLVLAFAVTAVSIGCSGGGTTSGGGPSVKASTAYYIGGIVEQAIGLAAPWFILAVLLFGYAVRSVYVESCALFVRGGVYRVVKEALGGFLAKVSVSVLLFDYILTGPTSGVSAGQYIMGLLFQFIKLTNPTWYSQWGLDSEAAHKAARSWGSMLI